MRDFSFPRNFAEGPSRGVSRGVAPINPRLNLTSDPVTPYHFPPPPQHNDENQWPCHQRHITRTFIIVPGERGGGSRSARDLKLSLVDWRRFGERGRARTQHGRSACNFSTWSDLLQYAGSPCIVSKWNGLTQSERHASIVSKWNGMARAGR